jgi:hypothetical protein
MNPIQRVQHSLHLINDNVNWASDRISILANYILSPHSPLTETQQNMLLDSFELFETQFQRDFFDHTLEEKAKNYLPNITQMLNETVHDYNSQFDRLARVTQFNDYTLMGYYREGLLYFLRELSYQIDPNVIEGGLEQWKEVAL